MPSAGPVDWFLKTLPLSASIKPFIKFSQLYTFLHYSYDTSYVTTWARVSRFNFSFCPTVQKAVEGKYESMKQGWISSLKKQNDPENISTPRFLQYRDIHTVGRAALKAKGQTDVSAEDKLNRI